MTVFLFCTVTEWPFCVSVMLALTGSLWNFFSSDLPVELSGIVIFLVLPAGIVIVFAPTTTVFFLVLVFFLSRARILWPLRFSVASSFATMWQSAFVQLNVSVTPVELVLNEPKLRCETGAAAMIGAVAGGGGGTWISNAPMSAALPPAAFGIVAKSCGRDSPR